MKKTYMKPEWKMTIFAEDAIRTSIFELNINGIFDDGKKYEEWVW